MYFSVNNSLRSGGNSGSTIFTNFSLYGGIKESIAASGFAFDSSRDREDISWLFVPEMGVSLNLPMLSEVVWEGCVLGSKVGEFDWMMDWSSSTFLCFED